MTNGIYAMSINQIESVAPEAPHIRATLAGQSYVQIERVNSDIQWSEQVHAVNWFNVRSLPLYNFYNLIAGRSVTKVGGAPLFKGRLTKQLVGSENDKRTVLLLVRYPSPVHFKTMVGNTYFKVVSLIRALAVKEFTFCLTQVSENINRVSPMDSSEHYAVHHFRGDKKTIAAVEKLCSGEEVDLVFASLLTHRLKTVGSGGGEAPVPHLMDGTLLLRASDASTLESMIESEDYQTLIAQTESSFVGLIERLM